ncbi:MAG TPA: hypothetical protein VGN70_01345 [Gammaproteobacteria bacterium]|jgi:hypothetical protein
MAGSPILKEWAALASSLERWAAENNTLQLRYDFKFSSYPPNMRCLISISPYDVYTVMSLKERAERYRVLAVAPLQAVRGFVAASDLLVPMVDVDRNVTAVILHHYGMGSTVDCSFVGTDVDWSINQFP